MVVNSCQAEIHPEKNILQESYRRLCWTSDFLSPLFDGDPAINLIFSGVTVLDASSQTIRSGTAVTESAYSLQGHLESSYIRLHESVGRYWDVL